VTSAATRTHRRGRLVTVTVRCNSCFAQSISGPVYPASTQMRSIPGCAVCAAVSIARAVPIGDVRGVNAGSHHQPACIHEQMALAPVQALGTVPAADPPFSVVFALWLSRVVALGSADRPARRRVVTRSSAFIRSQVPSRCQQRK